MAKSEYKMQWYDFIIFGIIFLWMSLAISFKWFSFMIGGKEYHELSSTKTSGLAYLIAKLEGSNWRFLLVSFFLFLAWICITYGYKEYKKSK